MKAAETKSTASNDKKDNSFLGRESSHDFFGGKENAPAFFSKNKAPLPVQTKLTIGQPDDKYEKEADSMADKVVQRLSEPSGLQTKPINPSSTITPFVQTKCASCEKEEKLQKKEEKKECTKEKLQKKSIDESYAEPPDNKNYVKNKCAECEIKEKANIQSKSESSSAQTASPSVESSLASSKGSGASLPDSTRFQMESSFGADFSNVRIHTNSNAVQMNKDLNAQAFTHGSDIYFNSGKYYKDSKKGQHLLAHELTHVVQQGAALKDGKSVNKLTNLAIQKNDGTIDNNERDRERFRIKDAIDNKDIGKIKRLSPYSIDNLADDTQRLDMINILLEQFWVGPLDEYYIEIIWNSFGESIDEIYAKNFGLWNKSIERGAELLNISVSMKLKLQFQQDVKNIALNYLSVNKQKAIGEKERYGLNDVNKPVSEQQSNELTGLNKKIQDTKKLLKIQDCLKSIEVGYFVTRKDFGSITVPTFGSTVTFDPAKKPTIPLANEQPPFERWSKVKDTYDKSSATIDGYTKEYPVLFALIQGGNIENITDNNDQKNFQNILRESLDSLLSNIEKAEGILNDPKSDFPLELDPIHQQMFDSYPPWNLTFQKQLGKSYIEQHGNIKFWESLGLAGIQAGLFIVAEITSGGLATFFLVAGAGGSIAIAADSWKKYLDSKVLSNANLSKETALLSKEKADSDLIEAVINTAFALLDLYGAGKTIAKGIKSEAELAKDLASAEKKELETLVESSEKDLNKTLEQTRNKSTLTKEEMNAEANWSKENMNLAIPSNTPGYVTEIKLPNGHTWRKTPEGTWCRFSEIPSLCVFDFEGASDLKTTRIMSHTEIAHDTGVQHGREYAESVLNLQDAGLVNPFEFHGKYGQGFDDIMRHGGEYFILEYKGGGSKLVEDQMQRDWVVIRINRMRNEGGEVGKYIADILEAKLIENKLSGVALSTPIAENGVPGATVEIARWKY